MRGATGKDGLQKTTPSETAFLAAFANNINTWATQNTRALNKQLRLAPLPRLRERRLRDALRYVHMLSVLCMRVLGCAVGLTRFELICKAAYKPT